MKKSEEKDRLIEKFSNESRQYSENADMFQRQNLKLQQDLKLALEKLEEMTNEAEHFAEESQESQKKFVDLEQKYQQYQIQTQETIKQFS